MKNVEDHIKAHASEKHFSCKICQTTVNNSYSLKDHIIAARKVTTPIMCPSCKEDFSSDGQL